MTYNRVLTKLWKEHFDAFYEVGIGVDSLKTERDRLKAEVTELYGAGVAKRMTFWAGKAFGHIFRSHASGAGKLLRMLPGGVDPRVFYADLDYVPPEEKKFLKVQDELVGRINRRLYQMSLESLEVVLSVCDQQPKRKGN